MAKYVRIVTDDIDELVPNKETFETSLFQSQIKTLTVNGWDTTEKTQTLSVRGISADENKQVIIPIPTLSSMDDYMNAGILCIAQDANSLTFKCKKIPSNAISLYVAVQDNIMKL